MFSFNFSHGFAVEKDEDNSVHDDDGAKTRLLVCGTEKGKHKCKNAKTAGIMKEMNYIHIYMNFTRLLILRLHIFICV